MDKYKPNRTSNHNIRKMTLTALFVALAILTNAFFRLNIQAGGITVMRISFAGPFMAFISLVCGPIYGGIAAMLVDIISFLQKPDGGFMWPFTVIAFCKYFLIGFIWHKLGAYQPKHLKNGFLAVFIGSLVISVSNLLVTNIPQASSSAYYAFLTSYEKETAFFTYGLLIFAVMGIGFYILTSMKTAITTKINFETHFILLVALAIPSLLSTVVVTVILKGFSLISADLFIYLLMPRIIKESLVVVYNVYMISVLLYIYQKVRGYRPA